MDIQLENKTPAYKHKFYYFVQDGIKNKQIVFKIEAVELVGEFNEKWFCFESEDKQTVKSKIVLSVKDFANWYAQKEAEGWKVFNP